MRRLAPVLAVPVLVGVPLWVEMSWLVAIVALASATLCLVAVLRTSLALATAGSTFALFSLALALRLSSSPANVLVMAVFGLALLLLLEGTHLCRRFRGATVTPSLWRRTLVWWTGRASISLALAIALAALAPLIAISLPPSWAPFAAGLGALAAFAAAVAFAWPAADD
jgi:hypothetical protein